MGLTIKGNQYSQYYNNNYTFIVNDVNNSAGSSTSYLMLFPNTGSDWFRQTPFLTMCSGPYGSNSGYVSVNGDLSATDLGCFSLSTSFLNVSTLANISTLTCQNGSLSTLAVSSCSVSGTLNANRVVAKFSQSCLDSLIIDVSSLTGTLTSAQLPATISSALFAANNGSFSGTITAGRMAARINPACLDSFTIDASSLTGTLSQIQLPTALQGTFTGDGSGLSKLFSSSLIGTLSASQLPSTYNGTFTGDGSKLTGLIAQSTSLDASSITGTLTNSQLPATITSTQLIAQSLNANVVISYEQMKTQALSAYFINSISWSMAANTATVMPNTWTLNPASKMPPGVGVNTLIQNQFITFPYNGVYSLIAGARFSTAGGAMWFQSMSGTYGTANGTNRLGSVDTQQVCGHVTWTGYFNANDQVAIFLYSSAAQTFSNVYGGMYLSINLLYRC